MDSDQPLPQTNSQQQTIQKNISEGATKYWGSHYEGFLHSLVNFAFSILNFLKFGLTKIINQVFDRE